MTLRRNVRQQTIDEARRNEREEARQARLVEAGNNAIDRRKLDEWLTGEMHRTKMISCGASERRDTENFWLHKGKIEALAVIRRQLRENRDVLDRMEAV